MDVLGSLVGGGGMSQTSNSRTLNAGNNIQDMLGSLLNSAGGAVGGTDNLAAAGIGALLGALTGSSKSTTANSLGGGAMGLLGMMAYKALKNSFGGEQTTQAQSQAQARTQSQYQQQARYQQPTPQQQENDAEILIIAMLDAAKADGNVDSEELTNIMTKIKSAGLGQEGVNYVLQKLQSPMETSRLVTAGKHRPELAAQIYSASLLAIDVDTEAERNYLNTLARSMGLNSNVVAQIEQMTGANKQTYSV